MLLRRTVAGLMSSPPLRVAYRWLGVVPGLGPLSRRVTRRIVPYGTRVWMQASLGDGVRSWLYVDPRYELPYLQGAYEAHNVRCLRETLRAGAVFYDVGAHIGVVSLLAAALVGRDGRVFAFEPDPDNFTRLDRTIERNGVAQVTLVPAAVWSASGVVTFQRAPALSSGNRGAVATAGAEGDGVRIEVKAVCLDEFAGDHPAPDVVKIDVEGGEIDVLHGATRLLRAVRPVVLCEIHGPAELRGFHEVLGPLGYTIDQLSASSEFPIHLLARPRAAGVGDGARSSEARR
jgi:FkbM family methyltransferase